MSETPVDKKKSTQVSTTLSPETYERLEDYRWSNRINKVSDIVAEAVEFFINSKATAAPADEPAKTAK